MFQHTFKVLFNAHVKLKCGFFGILPPSLQVIFQKVMMRLSYMKIRGLNSTKMEESDGVGENNCALLLGSAKIWVNVCGAFTYFRLSTTRPYSIPVIIYQLKPFP